MQHLLQFLVLENRSLTTENPVADGGPKILFKLAWTSTMARHNLNDCNSYDVHGRLWTTWTMPFSKIEVKPLLQLSLQE